MTLTSTGLVRPATLTDDDRYRRLVASVPGVTGQEITCATHVHVAVPQVARDVGEARAEDEHVHAMAVVGHRVQEVQQHPRVAAHRAGDVAQHHERRVPGMTRAPAQQRDASRLPDHLLHRRAQVDAAATRTRPPTLGEIPVRQTHVEPPSAANDLMLWTMETRDGLLAVAREREHALLERSKHRHERIRRRTVRRRCW